MKYDLTNDLDINRAKVYFDRVLKLGKQIELKENKLTRSQKQNKSLHVLFTIISYQLNNLGQTFSYEGLNGNSFEIRYTPNVVKNFIWRPIQIAMFDIESTTKINTNQINEIVDVLVKWFGEVGVEIEFPSVESINK
tara:strand:+ start:32 stop:442 length:411 start_codon:yes stop_codon:yes gene_type:complete